MSGFDFLNVYDGGSKSSYLIESMSGTYKNVKVSIPRHQMFVVFETTLTVARTGGFKASILENSIWIFDTIIVINKSFSKKIFIFTPRW